MKVRHFLYAIMVGKGEGMLFPKTFEVTCGQVLFFIAGRNFPCVAVEEGGEGMVLQGPFEVTCCRVPMLLHRSLLLGGGSWKWRDVNSRAL